MLRVFQYNSATGKVELEDGNLLLIKEFRDLMDDNRNKCKQDPTGKKHLRAFREFTYIWLAIDWNSLYKDYTIQERHQEALKDGEITEEEWNDPTFRAACRKYKELQNSSRAIKILHASEKAVDRITDYFNNIDPQERDEQTGKPIWKVKDLQTEISNIPKLLEELQTMEQLVKKEIMEQSKTYGGIGQGFEPKNF